MFYKKGLINSLFLLLLFGFSFNSFSGLLEERDRIAPNLVVHGTHETFAKIMEVIESKQKGVYYRFGDGEVYFAYGENILEHKASTKASQEVREAFAMNGPTIIKAIPLYCRELGGYEKGMYPGNHEDNLEWCMNILRKANALWGGEITDIYSHVALHFSATSYPEDCIKFLKFLRDHNCYAFIGNKNIPKHIRDLLFGANCKFIQTPSRDAYAEVDRIERECLEKIENDGEYKIVITAVGVVGKILQKRLWDKYDNVFFFDFGSLIDALCGWNTRAWIKLTKFNAKNFLNKMYSYGF